jgi:predicted DNA-binding protein (MmcQ/YjbR family)
MTLDQFRRLALSFAGTEEHAHHHHPDFRVSGKIFATLGYPDETRAMVILTPEQQAELLHDYPEVFAPAAGAWGRSGSTTICLPKAKKAMLQLAVQGAWQKAISAAASKKKKKPTSL